MVYFLIALGVLFIGVSLSTISVKLLTNYYEKANKVEAECNLTAFELLVFFITKLNLGIKVGKFSSYLDNSYNINKKVILLSNDVFDNKSVGALSVSMHELGHAIQHKNNGFVFKFYCFLKILNKISSYLIVPILLFLVVSLFLEIKFLYLALIILFCFYLINLLTRIIIIPLEKNASKLAINLLKEYNIFNSNEISIAKKLLNLACFTYVGGFFNIYIKFFKKILKGF